MVLRTLFLLSSFLVTPILAFETLNTSLYESESGDTKILSRRKRFLIFPDGSSFQVVFCTQTHGYLQIGDIVWFGTTAALAWELPSDPSVYSMLKSELRDPAARRQDVNNKHIYYLDEVGKVIAKVPYRRKPIVNPAFVKRSIQDEEIIIKNEVFIKSMHQAQKERNYLHNFDEASANFHRQGRHGLYKKMETFLEALGMGGKDCILRMLCEVGKAKSQQGTFLEEIFRATFTFPKGSTVESVEYDKAHNAAGDCFALYPECKDLHTHTYIHTYITSRLFPNGVGRDHRAPSASI